MLITNMLYDVVMNHDEMFAKFVAVRVSSPDRRLHLSASSQKVYGAIWAGFCKYLAGRQERWQDVTPTVALHYCHNGGQPRSSTKNTSDPQSGLSKNQAWRVLDKIYAVATADRLIASNPFQGIHELERPAVTYFVSPVLKRSHWLELHDRLARTPIDEHSHHSEVRNRVCLLLALHYGLTAQELCDLRAPNLTQTTSDLLLLIERKRSKGHKQERKVNIDAQDAKVLNLYSSMRAKMTVSAAVPTELHNSFFLSNQMRPISPRMCFHNIRQLLVDVFTQGNLTLPEHLGPQLLRNTAIVYWIRTKGLTAEQACERAGLKDPRALRWLRAHLKDTPADQDIAHALRTLPAVESPPPSTQLNLP